MKKFSQLAIAVITLIGFGCNSPQEEKAMSKYTYESIEGDPLGTRIYTLENGMKVYISVNKEAPRIQTQIAVRAGSKNDPSDATGLAHYLEHMLFKGGHDIGTSNWEEEKVLLDKISDLYEQQRDAEDEAEKELIYKKIDSVSYEASKLAIPNEYDKMVSSLGAKGTNAFTSYEMTVYINDIPSNELEKWLKLESERFRYLVLRLFHTELETVYEEFNRGQDNDRSKVYKKMDSLMFLKHNYGPQTTIGKGEHLKNPSMEKIHEYFNTNYVPNNMAIILAGDVDPEQAMDQITAYFGESQPKEVPSYTYEPEPPIDEVRAHTVYGPLGEYVQMGYRLGGSDTKDPLYAQLLSTLLNNGQAGLIDLNLIQKQKVLEAYAFDSELKDYSKFMMYGKPKEGQSLEEVRDLLLGELNKVRAGDFEDWMLTASANNLRLNKKRGQEQNWSRAFGLMDAFIKGKEYADVVAEDDRIAAISKEDFVKWVNEKFNENNYVIVYKKSGTDKSLHKVSKPQITPIEINRDVQSDFAMAFDSMASKRLDPLWVDYSKVLSQEKLQDGLTFSYGKNEVNDLFTLYYVLEMGKLNDPKLEMAVNYLPYLGTEKYSVEDLKKEFFKLGLQYDVFASGNRIYVYCSGLDESMAKGLELFEHLLNNAVPNEEALGELVKDEIKQRSDKKKEKGYIHGRAMTAFAKQGPKNSFNDVVSNEDLAKMDAQELVDILKSMTSYEHHVYYYGQRSAEDVKKVISEKHQVADELKSYPAEREYPELDQNSDQVYFVDYDMVQTEIRLISKDEDFNKELWPYALIFNEYFGSGLSSIIFQEIREAKGLAYSAYSAYSMANEAGKPSYVQAYVGTQRDKLTEALVVLLDLMNNMPQAPDQFEDAKAAALKKIESDRIVGRNVFFNYLDLKRRGIDYDVRKEQYEAIQNMTLESLNTFFAEHIKGKKFSFLVIGNKAEMDMESLEKLGPVQELSLEELFGY